MRGLRILQRKICTSAETTQDELNALVDKLNKDDKINGILCQLPLPSHLDDKEVINRIDPLKDVDAFHPVNVGAIMIGDYNCCLALLRCYGTYPFNRD